MAGLSGVPAAKPKSSGKEDPNDKQDDSMGQAEAAAAPDYSALTGDEVKALDVIPKELELLKDKIDKDGTNQSLINRYTNLEERHRALKEKLYKKN